MSVNLMSIEDSHAFLMSLYTQATGGQIADVNTADFTTVATTLLQQGYDAVISAISQVLSRTIFSIRPYSARFKGMEADTERWGAIVRKINFIDGAIEADDRLPLTDGQSVDQYVVNKPKTVQTNFYGATEYQRSVTIFRDQLDEAFTSEGQFNSFISGVMQNIADQLEQIKEAESRGTLINLVAGRFAQEAVPNVETGLCINVLQAYYDETGVQLTPANMFSGTNYPEFTKWFFAFINTLTSRMANRSELYHTANIGTVGSYKKIMRHTPAEYLKAYIYKPMMDKIDAQVLSTIFNPEYLKMIDFEGVDFWQSMDPGSEMKVSAYPTFLLNSGLLDSLNSTDDNPVGTDYLLGVLFDRDAAGITVESTWMEATPFNARGGYYNLFWHMKQRTWNDFTENAIVLYADTVTVPSP